MDQSLLNSMFRRCVQIGDTPCPVCPSCGDTEHFYGLITYAGCFSDDANPNITNIKEMVNAEKNMGLSILQRKLVCSASTPTCRHIRKKWMSNMKMLKKTNEGQDMNILKSNKRNKKKLSKQMTLNTDGGKDLEI